MTDGTGSGGPEKLSHLRAMTNSGLGKNKVTAMLPESAAKFYAQGANFTKEVTKVEVGFDDSPEQAQASGTFKRASNDDAGRTPLLNLDQKILAIRGINSVDEIAKRAPRFSQVLIANGLLGKNGDNEDHYMNGWIQHESDTERDYTQDYDEKEEEDEVEDDDRRGGGGGGGRGGRAVGGRLLRIWIRWQWPSGMEDPRDYGTSDAPTETLLQYNEFCAFMIYSLLFGMCFVFLDRVKQPNKAIVRLFSHELNTGKPKPPFEVLIDLLHLHFRAWIKEIPIHCVTDA